MDSTFITFLVLIIIVAFLLILAIMVQNPKGGGLSSSFGGGGSQQIGGVQKTGDFLDKSTWVLATILIGLILMANITQRSGNGVEKSTFENGAPTEQTTTDDAPPATDPTPSSDNTDGDQ